MDRKPAKRRLTWFGNNRPGAPDAPYAPISPKAPNTLGKMWRQEPHGRDERDGWLSDERQAPEEPAPSRSGWPSPPSRPPRPELEDERFASRSGEYERRDRWSGESDTGAYAAPASDQPDAAWYRPRQGRLRALWSTVTTSLRRPRRARVMVAGILALIMILGVTTLAHAFLSGAPNSAHGGPGAGSGNGLAVSSTAGQATPKATTTGTAAPVKTQPPAPLTVAFTCASGAIGGTGQVCAHTLPGATLTLSVRYCDGSYAKGKVFHSAYTADGSGDYTFHWNVVTTCAGAATATVTAKSAGQSVTKSVTFTVTQ